MSSDRYTSTTRSQVRRHPERAHYDHATVQSILDEGLVCHLAFMSAGAPCVIPMVYARVGSALYIHGAKKSRIHTDLLAAAAPVCGSVTIVDGLVLARSAFAHSMNYRSVVFFGNARELHDEQEKNAKLFALSEHLLPGCWAAVREPTSQELKGTFVIEIEIVEASAKVRQGPPRDAEADLAAPVWAGEIPLRIRPTTPIPQVGPAGAQSLLPDHIQAYLGSFVD